MACTTSHATVTAANTSFRFPRSFTTAVSIAIDAVWSAAAENPTLSITVIGL